MDDSPTAWGFASFPHVAPIATCGHITLNHVIRTSRLQEFATFGTRVNVICPDAVFDTGIWTEYYGLSIEQYKTVNLLHAGLTLADVVKLASINSWQGFQQKHWDVNSDIRTR